MTERPYRIRLTTSYYASLSWHGLDELGFFGGTPNPDLQPWAERLTDLGAAFAFCPPAAGGPLFVLLYQIPGYVDPSDPSEASEVFDSLRSALTVGSLDELVRRWPDRASLLPKWYDDASVRQLGRLFEGRGEQLDAVFGTWAEFLEAIWPGYRMTFDAQVADYPFAAFERQAHDLGTFEGWSAAFGWEYPFKQFVAVVCPASPTLASSLGPDRVVVGARHPWGILRQALIHEIGVRFPATHVFAGPNELSDLLRQDQTGVLRLLEAEVCYRKPTAFAEVEGDPFLRGMDLDRLVAWRGRQTLDLPFERGFAELYHRAKAESLL